MNQSVSANETVATLVKFSDIDHVIIILLLLVSLAVGALIAFFHYGDQTSEDFMFGSFKMKSVPVAFSLLARWFNLHPVIYS